MVTVVDTHCMVTKITIVEIKESARKHGVSDDDIRHAVANPVFVHYFEDFRMIVGPSSAAQLLEVGVNTEGHIFHAMPARPKYYRTR
jgi:hypothetical protein